MRRFWTPVIRPLVSSMRPASVLEIGAQSGALTELLLEHFRGTPTVVHSIDPVPEFDVSAWRDLYGPDRFVFHEARSLEVLGDLPPFDLVLIDGDHNWYTLFNELRALETAASKRGTEFPLVVCHDTAWPYARRDMYYDPETIPSAFRHPHAKQGMTPGFAGLVPGGGLNRHLDNAEQEGTARNGILTALEDFQVRSELDLEVRALPGMNGLGLVVPPQHAKTGGAADALRTFTSVGFMEELVEAVESERLRIEIQSQKYRLLLKRAQHVDAEAAKAERERFVQLGARLAEMEARASGLQQERDVLSRSIEDAGRSRARLEEEQAELAATAERLTGERAELEEEVSRLQSAEMARARLEDEMARLQAAHADQEERLRESEYDRRRLNRRLDERGSQADRLRDELRVGQQAAAELAASLRRVGEDVDRIDDSKAWRWGHAVTRLARRLTLRRAVGGGAVDLVRVRARAAQEAATMLADDLAPRGLAGRTDVAAPHGDAAALGGMPGERQRPVTEEASAERAHHEGLIRRIAAEVRNERATWQHGAQPVPTDALGMLVSEHPAAAEGPTVDVVVCIHDALEDVQRCLWSLLDRRGAAFRLILVNDGSEPATVSFLERMRDRNPAVTIVTNESGRNGYTVAANLGLRESTADYVVLLNSDTVVTHGWLDRIVACGESDPRIGVIGPLSNAASHQSVPLTREHGAWADNELPAWLTADATAALVAACSSRAYPRFPFVNGFCYAIKREALNRVGYFDEDRFERGYCEENDFSFRALDAGFQLAVADDAYVFHAKSRSYSSEGRTALARSHYELFLEKHGEEPVRRRVEGLEADRSLEPLRASLTPVFDDEAEFRRRFSELFPRPLEVAFVLPGLAEGSSGGAHSVYQEVRAMRSLGIPAWIALEQGAWERASRAYPDAAEVFVPYADGEDLAAKMRSADVAVATHYRSVGLVRELVERRPELLPAYYVQDYEPLFADPSSEAYQEALDSYTAVPGQVLFAKTWWLCEFVTLARGVPVRKVEPSLDREIFRAPRLRVAASDGRPLQVVAMVRPRTPRRKAALTLRVLVELQQQLAGELRVVSFGCSAEQLAGLGVPGHAAVDHRGVLTRAEMGELLQQSDVFLDCSVYQAFGRTALEAMACGCVPLVPTLGGHLEFARDGVNAIAVDTATEQTVVDAVRAVAEDRERLEQLRAQAVDTAGGYSATRAALSEYLLFEEERRRRRREPGVHAPVLRSVDAAAGQ